MAEYHDNQSGGEEEIRWKIRADGTPYPDDGKVDTEAILANLKLTPSQRLEKMQRAVQYLSDCGLLGSKYSLNDYGKR